MSGLKSKINRLVRNNFVYFSTADLAVIRDQFKGYVDDQGATVGQYKKAFEELETALDRRIKGVGNEYRDKLDKLYESDVKAYYAWMYKIHAGLHRNHQDGLWSSDAKFIGILLQKLENARRYFDTKRDEGV